MVPSPSLTLTISAYLISTLRVSGLIPYCMILLGELDVVEDDERTFYIEHGSVVNSGSDVVVGGDCFNVYLRFG